MARTMSPTWMPARSAGESAATERTRTSPVEAVVPDRGDPRREAEGELEHLHPQQSRGQVMTELVDGDDRGERQKEQDEGREEVHCRLGQRRRGFERSAQGTVDAEDLTEVGRRGRALRRA